MSAVQTSMSSPTKCGKHRLITAVLLLECACGGPAPVKSIAIPSAPRAADAPPSSASRTDSSPTIPPERGASSTDPPSERVQTKRTEKPRKARCAPEPRIADRFELQHALMPYDHLLPQTLRGRNERIDDRFPESGPALPEDFPESNFAWENE